MGIQRVWVGVHPPAGYVGYSTRYGESTYWWVIRHIHPTYVLLVRRYVPHGDTWYAGIPLVRPHVGIHTHHQVVYVGCLLGMHRVPGGQIPRNAYVHICVCYAELQVTLKSGISPCPGHLPREHVYPGCAYMCTYVPGVRHSGRTRVHGHVCSTRRIYTCILGMHQIHGMVHVGASTCQIHRSAGWSGSRDLRIWLGSVLRRSQEGILHIQVDARTRARRARWSKNGKLHPTSPETRPMTT